MALDQLDFEWAISVLISRVAQLESINDIKEYMDSFPSKRPDLSFHFIDVYEKMVSDKATELRELILDGRKEARAT